MVATPIGNLEDITLRALRVLKEVDLIACEDTRVTGKLLAKYEIKNKMLSLHSHSKQNKFDLVLNKLVNGEDVAYVTDAGTPGVSDPGFALIKAIRSCHPEQNEGSQDSSPAVQNDISIIPIPGSSAVVSAVSVSDLVNKEFFFAGFLPKKKGRQTKFKELREIQAPIVIYESVLRLERTLRDIEEYLGSDTGVFIAREMTKMFEEYWSGSVEEILADLKNHKLKGEIVLIVRKIV